MPLLAGSMRQLEHNVQAAVPQAEPHARRHDIALCHNIGFAV